MMKSLVISHALKAHSANELSSQCKKFLLAVSVLFLFAMHIPNLGQSGLALTFNVTTWIAFSFVIAIGSHQINKQKQLRYSKLTVIFTISCFLLTLPAFYSNADWQNSYQRIITLWFALLFFVLLQQFNFKNRKQTLLWFVLLAIFLQMALGYMQLLFLYLDQPLGLKKTYLPIGIFTQKDAMASFLATGFAISAYVLPFKTPFSGRFFLLSFPMLVLPLLFILQSNIGWLAMGLAWLLLLPYCFQFLEKNVVAIWLGNIFWGLILGYLASISMLDKVNVQDNYEVGVHTNMPMVQDNMGVFFNRDMGVLFNRVMQSWDMFLQKPFFGYGYGRFERSSIEFSAEQYLKNASYLVDLPSTHQAQNETLFWAVEGGILPFIGILLAAGAVFLMVLKANKTRKLATMAMFIPIVLQSQLASPFYSSFVHLLVMIILLWWVDNYSSHRFYALKSFTRTSIKVFSFTVPIFICVFMVMTLQAHYWLNRYEETKHSTIALLDNILLPFTVQQSIEKHIYTAYLKNGIAVQDKAMIKLYIDWAQKKVRTNPELDYYLMLIAAFKAIDNENAVKSITAEARYLFPKTIF